MSYAARCVRRTVADARPNSKARRPPPSHHAAQLRDRGREQEKLLDLQHFAAVGFGVFLGIDFRVVFGRFGAVLAPYALTKTRRCQEHLSLTILLCHNERGLGSHFVILS